MPGKRPIASAAAGALLVIAGAGLTCRYAPWSSRYLLAFTAFFPLTIFASAAAVLLSVSARRWLMAWAAAAMSAIIIGTQIPLYVAQGPAAAGVTVKVMNANLRKGTADAEAVVASARNNADVLAVEELTSASLERLTAAGLDQTFPHRYVVARPGADGMGVWSRYPLTATHLRHDMHVPLIVTAVEIPGLAIAPTVAVAHPRNPWRGREWTADIEGLSRTLIHLRRSTRAAVIVAGDLNSTYDMRAFRDLLRDGYRDAAEQAGTAWSPTFPAGLLIPPVLTIDHVLTLRCTATAAMTITIAGSDHRALTTTVVIP